MESGADIVKNMGYITLATRLKRISDKMSHSARLMYRELNLEMEPNWYLILLLTKENPVISVMEIAASLGFTHQSVDIITKKMVKAGYLGVTKDTRDKRKTVFYLTSKGINILPVIKEIWEKGSKVIMELIDEDLSIIKKLNEIEAKLDDRSFGKRILEYDKQSNPT